MDEIDRIFELISGKGTVWYGREAITLQQHSLQTARLAEPATTAAV